MKGFLTIFSLFICIFGLFYVQSTFALKEDVKVEFKKVSGSESELKNIILSATYQGKQKHLLKITDEKTIDIKTESFLYRLGKRDDRPSFDMEILHKQHPIFMWGKDSLPYYYYEDEKILAYSIIKAQTFKLEIEVLNKQSNRVTSIAYDIPEQEKYERVIVDDVQVINGELKVITTGYLKDDIEILNILTFDIEKQKLINMKTIDKVQHGQIILENNTTIYPQKYLFFRKDASRSDQPKSEYFFYNIEKDQLKKFPGFSDIPHYIWYRVSIFDSKIYIPSSTEKGLEVRRYDIDKEKWESTLTFPYGYIKEDYSDVPFHDIHVPTIYLIQGKLYVIRPTNNGDASIHIGDLNTGELLYEGKLTVNKPLEERIGHRLSIVGLRFVYEMEK